MATTTEMANATKPSPGVKRPSDAISATFPRRVG